MQMPFCLTIQTNASPEKDAGKNYTALPMLTSACPGWICYAEKSNPNTIPYISTTKSPQQIIGTLIKRGVMFPRKDHGVISPNEIYHVSIMPCYDKKLEASRKDFVDAVHDATEVDSVLVTTEVLELLERLNLTFSELAETEPTALESAFSGFSADGLHLMGATSGLYSGSGGYLEHIFRYTAKRVFNVEIEGPLEYLPGRNPDFREVHLEVDGKIVLNFAQAYGFRNIQGIITKLRRNKCPYQFVEIMACPQGCLNGGGQIKQEVTESSSSIPETQQTLFNQRQVREPHENPLVQDVYEQVLRQQPFSDQAKEMLHTRYHAVPKLEVSNPLGIKW